MNKKDEIIWNNIETLRKQRGWTYTELAKRAGTGTSGIGNIKQGIRGIGNALIKKFAAAFNVDEEVLLSDSKVHADTYPYKIENKLTHDKVEDILNSGDLDSINNFNAGMNRVMMGLKKKKDVDLQAVIRKMAKDIEELKRKMQ